mmetsp:Transcript_36417/g.88624  ORF Transcript_36417/g.88624 Transcript_36417/m.88624 type:complete len:1004 (-) Transcript_36417:115-3126(-)
MPGQEQHMLLSKHHAVSSTCEPEPKDVGRTIYDDEQICEPGTRLETEDVPGQRSSSIATANGVPISTLEAHHQLLVPDSTNPFSTYGLRPPNTGENFNDACSSSAAHKGSTSQTTNFSTKEPLRKHTRLVSSALVPSTGTEEQCVPHAGFATEDAFQSSRGNSVAASARVLAGWPNSSEINMLPIASCIPAPMLQATGASLVAENDPWVSSSSPSFGRAITNAANSQAFKTMVDGQYEGLRKYKKSRTPGTAPTKPSAEMLEMIISPSTGQLDNCNEGATGFKVRLILTVSSILGTKIGDLQNDCGECQYCLDKPKYGGKGTKRQKCVRKRLPPQSDANVLAATRVLSNREFNLLESFRNKLPPPELSSAAAQGPLPLVWGFRRARRARPLNPAYVLMYHCEGTVPFDCSFLKTSLEHRCLGSRQRSNSNHMLMPFDDAQDDGHLRDETSNEDEQDTDADEERVDMEPPDEVHTCMNAAGHATVRLPSAAQRHAQRIESFLPQASRLPPQSFLLDEYPLRRHLLAGQEREWEHFKSIKLVDALYSVSRSDAGVHLKQLVSSEDSRLRVGNAIPTLSRDDSTGTASRSNSMEHEDQTMEMPQGSENSFQLDDANGAGLLISLKQPLKRRQSAEKRKGSNEQKRARYQLKANSNECTTGTMSIQNQKSKSTGKRRRHAEGISAKSPFRPMGSASCRRCGVAWLANELQMGMCEDCALQHVLNGMSTSSRVKPMAFPSTLQAGESSSIQGSYREMKNRVGMQKRSVDAPLVGTDSGTEDDGAAFSTSGFRSKGKQSKFAVQPASSKVDRLHSTNGMISRVKQGPGLSSGRRPTRKSSGRRRRTNSVIFSYAESDLDSVEESKQVNNGALRHASRAFDFSCESTYVAERDDDTHELWVDKEAAAMLRLLKCAVCLGTLNGAVAVPCMHRFCQACIEKWVRIGRHECPTCKYPIKSRRTVKRDKRIDEMVAILQSDSSVDAAGMSLEEVEAAGIERVDGIWLRSDADK